MNEESTQNLSGTRSFEERVFMRFDAVDARLEKLESRAYDTKPIWERALKAILETNLEVGEIKSRVGVIESKVAGVETEVAGVKTEVAGMKTEVAEVKTEVAEVKTEVASMKTDYASIRNDLTDMKRELKHRLNQKLDLILKFLLEDREDIRDAEERIKQLESKLA